MKKISKQIVENAIEYWTRRSNELTKDLLSEKNIASIKTNLEELLQAFDRSSDEHLHSQTFQMKTVVDEFQKIIDDLYGKF